MWGFICPIKLLNWMFYLKLNFIFSFRVPQKPHNCRYWTQQIYLPLNQLDPLPCANMFSSVANYLFGSSQPEEEETVQKMELETSPAKDDDWLIVNVQGTSHTASTNKHMSCTIVTYCMLKYILNSLNIYVFLFLWCYITLHSNHANISCYYFCLDACFTKQPHLVFRFAQQTVLDGW